MTDHFALLGVPRRPWLGAELLKQRFLELSADCHPDRVHHANEGDKLAAQNRFTELNSAYQALLDHRERLLGLIELELGTRTNEMQPIPPDLMTLFLEVGKLCREADAFLADKATHSSPLLKVELFERGHLWVEKLVELQQRVEGWRDGLLAEIRELDSGWEALTSAEKPERLRLLQRIAGLMNYSKKWLTQIQERIVQLSF